MTKTTDMDRERAEPRASSARMSTPELRAWFVREVVPLEPELMQYLQHNWRNRSDIVDLRQEVYARVFDAARTEIPERTRQFVFRTARNLLINRVLHEQIVPIEAVVDLEALNIAMDAPDPERSVIAREELRRLQIALDTLPPRCREAIVLRKIENLSIREIVQRMGVSENTVKMHLANGVRVLTEALYGQASNIRGVR
jgi:RNA polymerase sigma-70 factor (ECF subfamily)